MKKVELTKIATEPAVGPINSDPKLIDLYINKKLSVKDCAKELWIDERTASKRLRKNGIKIRQRFEDLGGKQFGRWKVIKRATNSKDGSTKWHCVCKCGKKKIVSACSLRSGRSRSCGCKKIEEMRKIRGKKHPSFKAGKHLNRQGYVLMLARDHSRSRKGYVFEHIIVMERHLGRSLSKDETIHHKNGIKHDNRLENLELWSGNHSKGARVSDKIKYYIEFLKKYAPEMLSEKVFL